MYNKLILAVTVLIFTASATAPAFANENIYSFNDQFSSHTGMKAGFYVSLSFNGGLKDYKHENFKYGAQFGITHDYNNGTNTYGSANFGQRKQFTTDIADLSFNQTGFKNLSLSGRDILEKRNGYVVLTSQDQYNFSASKVALGSLAIIGGLAIVVVGVAIAIPKSD